MGSLGTVRGTDRLRRLGEVMEEDLKAVNSNDFGRDS
jgi:hypothetical protein